MPLDGDPVRRDEVDGDAVAAELHRHPMQTFLFVTGNMLDPLPSWLGFATR
ncbi:MAG: hypothetical protein ACRDN0_10645 [Trebonia sp.]